MEAHSLAAHVCVYLYNAPQKLSTSTEKRGARASFKLSKKLPFIKKVGKSATADGTEDGKGECFNQLRTVPYTYSFFFCGCIFLGIFAY